MENFDRRKKTVSIDGKEMNILEFDLESIFEKGEELVNFQENVKDNFGLKEMKELFLKLGEVATDWTEEQLMKLTPRQVKALFPIVEELNQDFLQILEQMGVPVKNLKLVGEVEPVQEEVKPATTGTEAQPSSSSKSGEPSSKKNEKPNPSATPKSQTGK